MSWTRARALDAAPKESTNRVVTRRYLDARLTQLEQALTAQIAHFETRLLEQLASQMRWLMGLMTTQFVVIMLAIVGPYFR
jgi:hypothetical protein